MSRTVEDGRLESVSQPRGQQESGTRHYSSREAATEESPARKCREGKWNKVESRRDGTLVAAQTGPPPACRSPHHSRSGAGTPVRRPIRPRPMDIPYHGYYLCLSSSLSLSRRSSPSHLPLQRSSPLPHSPRPQPRNCAPSTTLPS